MVPGSAAKVAVLANNISAVAKSTCFIWFIFLRFDNAFIHVRCASRARCPPPFRVELLRTSKRQPNPFRRREDKCRVRDRHRQCSICLARNPSTGHGNVGSSRTAGNPFGTRQSSGNLGHFRTVRKFAGETGLAGWGGRIRTLESREAASRVDRNGGGNRRAILSPGRVPRCCITPLQAEVAFSALGLVGFRGGWHTLEPVRRRTGRSDLYSIPIAAAR